MKLSSQALRPALLALAVALLLPLFMTTPANAAPAEGDSASVEEQAREQAAAETAESVCNGLEGIHGDLAEQCATSLAEVLESSAAEGTLDALGGAALCAPTAAMPIIFAGCTAFTATNMDEIVSGFNAALEEARATLGAAVSTVAFIANPGGVLDQKLNEVKEGAVSLFTTVMERVIDVGDFDPTQNWWRDTYAVAAGLGMLVLAFMTVLALYSGATQQSSPGQIADTMRSLPVAMFAMVFSPAVMYPVQRLVDALSSGIVQWMGPSAVENFVNAAVFDRITNATPGGWLLGLIVFILLLIGALLVLVTFVLQGMAAYLLGITLAIAWGMIVHPRWRSKALRIPAMFLAVLFAKPALLFMLGVISMLIQGFAPLNLGQDDPVQILSEAAMILIALFMIGLAPMVLMKFIPLLPDGSEGAPAAGAVGGGLAGAGAGAMGGKLAAERASAPSSSSATPSSPSGPSSSSTGPSSSSGASSSGSPSTKGASAGSSSSASGPSSGPSSSSGTGPSSARPGKGAGGGAASPASGGGGAAAGAKAGGGAAGSAAGGASTAGSAAGGAATGGALLAAQFALKAASSAGDGAKNLAVAAAPETPSDPMEGRVDMNDHRGEETR